MEKGQSEDKKKLLEIKKYYCLNKFCRWFKGKAKEIAQKMDTRDKEMEHCGGKKES